MRLKRAIKIIFFLDYVLAISFFPEIFWANENLAVLRIDQATVGKGYTVATPDGNLKIAIWPGAISQEIYLVLKTRRIEDVSIPQTKNLVSDFYEFEIKGDDLIINKPFTLQLNYNSNSSTSKAIYFYNYSTKVWSKVEPLKLFLEERFIRTSLKIPYALFAVLEEKVISGKASWYKYKNCDCTASPDYPSGSQLRVTNLGNNKSIIVTVNDYGPDRDIHPDRVIDLDVIAFKKIAAKSSGIIDVTVENVSP